MKKDNLKLITGVTVAILFIAGFYYYTVIYRNSFNDTNPVQADVPNVETSPQPSSLPHPSGSSGSGGGGSSGGLPKLK